MNTLAKIISTTTDNAKRRILKFLRQGNDAQTGYESAPFGIDGVPFKDMVAIHATTQRKGESVILGYINKNQLAAVGELHLYSTNAQGVEQFRIKIKNNNTCELGGNADNSVRYTPLNQGAQDFKDLLAAEFVKIQMSIAQVGGVYTPGTLTFDISNSKINEIKTL